MHPRIPTALNREADLKAIAPNDHVIPQTPQDIPHIAPFQHVGPLCLVLDCQFGARGPCLVGVRRGGDFAVACDVDEVGDEGVGVEEEVAEVGLFDAFSRTGVDEEGDCGVFYGDYSGRAKTADCGRA